jgi:hypothetical protein
VLRLLHHLTTNKEGKMTYYAITASVQHTDEDGWAHNLHLPTFYLHSNVQGILNEEQAQRVATNMLYDVGQAGEPERDVRITVTAVAQHD